MTWFPIVFFRGRYKATCAHWPSGGGWPLRIEVRFCERFESWIVDFGRVVGFNFSAV